MSASRSQSSSPSSGNWLWQHGGPPCRAERSHYWTENNNHHFSAWELPYILSKVVCQVWSCIFGLFFCCYGDGAVVKLHISVGLGETNAVNLAELLISPCVVWVFKVSGRFGTFSLTGPRIQPSVTEVPSWPHRLTEDWIRMLTFTDRGTTVLFSDCWEHLVKLQKHQFIFLKSNIWKYLRRKQNHFI